MKTIAFDFDGVLAQYDRWRGYQHLGEPIEGMRDVLQMLKFNGWKIIIFTTRGNAEIAQWCKDYSMPYDYINMNPEIQGNNPGKPIASIYVDDLAIRFTGDIEALLEDIRQHSVTKTKASDKPSEE
jgi:hypothetical protein